MSESLVLLSHLLPRVIRIQLILSSPERKCLKCAKKGAISHASGGFNMGMLQAHCFMYQDHKALACNP